MVCRDPDNGDLLEDGYCNILQRPKEVIPCPFDLNFLRSLNCPGNYVIYRLKKYYLIISGYYIYIDQVI